MPVYYRESVSGQPGSQLGSRPGQRNAPPPAFQQQFSSTTTSSGPPHTAQTDDGTFQGNFPKIPAPKSGLLMDDEQLQQMAEEWLKYANSQQPGSGQQQQQAKREATQPGWTRQTQQSYTIETVVEREPGTEVHQQKVTYSGPQRYAPSVPGKQQQPQYQTYSVTKTVDQQPQPAQSGPVGPRGQQVGHGQPSQQQPQRQPAPQTHQPKTQAKPAQQTYQAPTERQPQAATQFQQTQFRQQQPAKPQQQPPTDAQFQQKQPQTQTQYQHQQAAPPPHQQKGEYQPQQPQTQSAGQQYQAAVQQPTQPVVAQKQPGQGQLQSQSFYERSEWQQQIPLVEQPQQNGGDQEGQQPKQAQSVHKFLQAQPRYQQQQPQQAQPLQPVQQQPKLQQTPQQLLKPQEPPQQQQPQVKAQQPKQFQQQGGHQQMFSTSNTSSISTQIVEFQGPEPREGEEGEEKEPASHAQQSQALQQQPQARQQPAETAEQEHQQVQQPQHQQYQYQKQTQQQQQPFQSQQQPKIEPQQQQKSQLNAYYQPMGQPQKPQQPQPQQQQQQPDRDVSAGDEQDEAPPELQLAQADPERVKEQQQQTLGYYETRIPVRPTQGAYQQHPQRPQSQPAARYGGYPQQQQPRGPAGYNQSYYQAQAQQHPYGWDQQQPGPDDGRRQNLQEPLYIAAGPHQQPPEVWGSQQSPASQQRNFYYQQFQPQKQSSQYYSPSSGGVWEAVYGDDWAMEGHAPSFTTGSAWADHLAYGQTVNLDRRRAESEHRRRHHSPVPGSAEHGYLFGGMDFIDHQHYDPSAVDNDEPWPVADWDRPSRRDLHWGPPRRRGDFFGLDYTTMLADQQQFGARSLSAEDAQNYHGYQPLPPRKNLRLCGHFTADSTAPLNIAEAQNLDELDSSWWVGDTLSNQKVPYHRALTDEEKLTFALLYGPGGFKPEHRTVRPEPKPEEPVQFSVTIGPRKAYEQQRPPPEGYINPMKVEGETWMLGRRDEQGGGHYGGHPGLMSTTATGQLPFHRPRQFPSKVPQWARERMQHMGRGARSLDRSLFAPSWNKVPQPQPPFWVKRDGSGAAGGFGWQQPQHGQGQQIGQRQGDEEEEKQKQLDDGQQPQVQWTQQQGHQERFLGQQQNQGQQMQQSRQFGGQQQPKEQWQPQQMAQQQQHGDKQPGAGSQVQFGQQQQSQPKGVSTTAQQVGQDQAEPQQQQPKVTQMSQQPAKVQQVRQQQPVAAQSGQQQPQEGYQFEGQQFGGASQPPVEQQQQQGQVQREQQPERRRSQQMQPQPWNNVVQGQPHPQQQDGYQFGGQQFGDGAQKQVARNYQLPAKTHQYGVLPAKQPLTQSQEQQQQQQREQQFQQFQEESGARMGQQSMMRQGQPSQQFMSHTRAQAQQQQQQPTQRVWNLKGSVGQQQRLAGTDGRQLEETSGLENLAKLKLGEFPLKQPTAEANGAAGGGGNNLFTDAHGRPVQYVRETKLDPATGQPVTREEWRLLEQAQPAAPAIRGPAGVYQQQQQRQLAATTASRPFGAK